jgi:hypothetical protein
MTEPSASTPRCAKTARPTGDVRQVRLRTSGASIEQRRDGSILVRPDEPLGAYPRVLTDRLGHWAEIAPERICAAKRDENGNWRSLTYAQVYAAARSIGQALLDIAEFPPSGRLRFFQKTISNIWF